METKKYEWKKAEKELYLPKTAPVAVDVPKFKYFAVKGDGNPNGDGFSKRVEALYSMSYGVSMSYKKGTEPKGFYKYAVYPLEGVWDLSKKAKQKPQSELNKDELVYTIMIRQPDFVSLEYFERVKETAFNKKGNELIKDVLFLEEAGGLCCQMMHMGSYDDEPQSFMRLEEYCSENGYIRAEKTHREIYISDPRRTEPSKLKTVLRFKII